MQYNYNLSLQKQKGIKKVHKKDITNTSGLALFSFKYDVCSTTKMAARFLADLIEMVEYSLSQIYTVVVFLKKEGKTSIVVLLRISN